MNTQMQKSSISEKMNVFALVVSLLMGGFFVCAATYFQVDNYVNSNNELMIDLWLTAGLFVLFSIFQIAKVVRVRGRLKN